jgi:hypothetical protein
MFGLKSKTKTNYEGGYLIDTPSPLYAKHILSVSEKFVAPRKIDNRDMCLSSSNQGATPHCAGYSMAGYIEFQNWKTLHYPKQVNGDNIYLKAKKTDDYRGDGTSLISVARTALAMGLIKGKYEYVQGDRAHIKFALHEHGVCLIGFKITSEWNNVNKRGEITKMLRPKSLGGHAVLLCGYDKRGVYIQNSWSTKWGNHGFALMTWELFDAQIMSAMVIS